MSLRRAAILAAAGGRRASERPVGTPATVLSEASRWRVSSVVSVESGISFQLVKLPNTVGWTAPMQKSIQNVFL